MTQEFLISVTPVKGKPDEYIVRTERVAPGVPLAEEQVNWPVENWQGLARQLLNDPLWGLLEGKAILELDGTNKEKEIPNLVALGQELYRSLFSGTLRDSWNCAQSIAHNRSEVLHLRLGLKDRRLPQLPWEIMHRGDRPLATGTDVVFSRYQPSTSLLVGIRKVPVNQPLKILMAIAAPSDREGLEVAQEYLQLKEELREENTSEKRQIQLDILQQPNREELTQALERGQYQVFHYAGHSNWGTSGGELYLVSGKTGLTESLSGDDLAGLLANNGIQVAVFNSCRGAYSEPADSTNGQPAPNLAEAIVNRGVPGVLAMAERIPDAVSIALTRLFYRHLAKDSASVTESLSRARQGLVSAYGSEKLYWALPVLYVHSAYDGYLLANKEESEKSEELKIDVESLRQQRERNKTMALYAELQKLAKANLAEMQDLEPKSDRLEYKEEKLPGDDFKLPIYGFEEDGELEDVDLPLDDLEYGEGDRSEEDSALVAEIFGEVTNSELARKPEPGGAIALNSPQKAALAISESRQNTDNPPSTDKNKKVKPRWRNLLKVSVPLIWVAAMGVGTWFYLNRGPQPAALLPSPPPDPVIVKKAKPIKEPMDLDSARTREVTAKAIEFVSQNDLAEAKLAIESLLDLGALWEAKAALAAVPNELQDDPTILFLQGRLAWQFVRQGDNNYSVEDARRYWQLAVKKNPHSIEYRNALGFAHYAEGNLIQAYQAWLQVTDMLNASGAENLFDSGGTNVTYQPAASTTISSEPSLAQIEFLNAYAGIGLFFLKSAENLPPEKKAIPLSKAIKFRQKVMSDAPVNFQPFELSQNWMWSENAIRDWRLLLSKK